MKSKREIPSSTRGLWGLFAVMLCLLCPISAVSAESSETPSDARQRAFGGPDAIANRLESDRVSTDTLLELNFPDSNGFCGENYWRIMTPNTKDK